MPNQYETKTKAQLIKILRSRSLSLKGEKSELVQRLFDADEAHVARNNQLDLGSSLSLQNDGRPTVSNLFDIFSLTLSSLSAIRLEHLSNERNRDSSRNLMLKKDMYVSLIDVQCDE